MTLILAKLYGIYMFTVGIALFMNPERFKRWYQSLINDDSQILFGGLIAILVGAFTVSVHNIWVFSWPVLITIFGWAGVAKGVGLMCFPNFKNLFHGMMSGPDNLFKGMGLFWAVVGAFFIYQGWM